MDEGRKESWMISGCKVGGIMKLPSFFLSQHLLSPYLPSFPSFPLPSLPPRASQSVKTLHMFLLNRDQQSPDPRTWPRPPPPPPPPTSPFRAPLSVLYRCLHQGNILIHLFVSFSSLIIIIFFLF